MLFCYVISPDVSLNGWNLQPDSGSSLLPHQEGKDLESRLERIVPDGSILYRQKGIFNHFHIQLFQFLSVKRNRLFSCTMSTFRFLR